MTEQQTVGQRVKHGFESKILVPLAVTVVSAAASYLIKKLPLLLEEKVLPKLREQGGAEGVKNAVVETAATVAERAAEVVPGRGDDATPTSTDDNRTEERRRREERRRERKRALQKA